MGAAHTALLAGATGLVGRALLPLLLARYRRVHVLLRRPAALPEHPSLQAHVVDFARLQRLPRADDAYCCLGTTIAAAGSQAAFRAVDFDAVLAFARAARGAGAERFAVVSALGADHRSRTFYSRVKGEMEQAVSQVRFRRVVIARPSLLVGDRAALGQPARRGEHLALALARPLAPLLPRAWRPVDAERVARGLIDALAEDGERVRIVASAELHDGSS